MIGGGKSVTANHARDLCSGEDTLVMGSLRGYRSWDLEIFGNPLIKGKAEQDLPDFTGLFAVGKSIPWTQPMIAGCYMYGRCPCETCGRGRQRRGVKPHHHDAVVPVAECECGIYGWYTPGWIEKDNWWPKSGAVGVIEATGKVIMGQRGFRCEQAKILAIAPACKPDILEHSIGVHGYLQGFDRIRTRLVDLGISIFDDFDSLLNFYPPDDVTSLIDNVEVA